MNTKILAFVAALVLIVLAPCVSLSSQVPPALDYVKVIKKLQPAMSGSDAHHLNIALKRVMKSGTCKVSPALILSIAFHESSLRKSAIGRLRSDTKDYGLMQINEKTALSLKLDRVRLMKDEAYSLQAGCQVLTANRQRYSHKVPYWLGMYRAGVKVQIPAIRKNAIEYDRMIRGTATKIEHSIVLWL